MLNLDKRSVGGFFVRMEIGKGKRSGNFIRLKK
jgi:hypothetical protein